MSIGKAVAIDHNARIAESHMRFVHIMCEVLPGHVLEWRRDFNALAFVPRVQATPDALFLLCAASEPTRELTRTELAVGRAVQLLLHGDHAVDVDGTGALVCHYDPCESSPSPRPHARQFVIKARAPHTCRTRRMRIAKTLREMEFKCLSLLTNIVNEFSTSSKMASPCPALCEASLFQ